MKHTITSILLCITLSIYAQESFELTGEIIGTEICVDYSNNNTETTTVNTTSNLFDNDLTTFFATFQHSGGWAGLDLGEKHIITSVAYCPREGQEERLLLGLFEGANNPDFGDAIPLLLIDEQPSFNRMTERQIDCSRGFRYVRYVGPNNVRCNIAELKFYGYKGEGSYRKLPAITDIPSVVIHTVNAEDITEKERYLKGIVSVIYDGGKKIYTDSLEIRGRGNSSWTFSKKPYRMKLYNKASLLGMPAKERNWTLINNYGDKTLMRNFLAFDLSRRFEMSYTPAGKFVNVFLNGEFKGCYQLCDHMEVKSGRVEVEEIKQGHIRLPELSGGYLIEIDALAKNEALWFTSAYRNTPVAIKYPDDDDIAAEQLNYIVNHFNKLEQVLYSNNFGDPQNGYRQYLDTESFIKHFLVGEISGNTDTYWSVYMYKKRNNDRFYTGPVWDFDLAYDNDKRTYPINDLSGWVYNTKGSTASGMRQFVNRLFSDPDFVAEVKEIYAFYRNSGAITEEALFKVVDDYALELEQAQVLNFMRWKILDRRVHLNPQALGSYCLEVDYVKSYISNRIQKVDEFLGFVPDVSNESVLTSKINIWNEGNRICIKGLAGNASIYIYDQIGRMAFTGNVHNSFVKSFDKGFYVVKVVENNMVTKVSKVIVSE